MNSLSYSVWHRCRVGSRQILVACRRTLCENNDIKQGAPSSVAVESPSTGTEIVPIFKKAGVYLDRIAIKDGFGHYSYYTLGMGSKQISNLISQELGNKTNERIAFLCPNDSTYILAQWAIWMSGQIAVPLSHLHPPEMLEYYVNDCAASVLITTPKFADIMDTVARKTKKRLLFIDDSIRRNSTYDSVDPTRVCIDEAKNLGQKDEFYKDSDAMILYTSGTTGQPKGVVLTHRNLQAQMMALIKAWQMSYKDCVLHTLPLHHVHGIVNVLMCPLYVGARCIMLPKFDTNNVWTHLLSINLRPDDNVNVYMGVPTIYTKLIQEYDKIFKPNPNMVDYVKQTLKEKIRLMVCGSASLPQPIFNRWYEITGHKLLERYGMTEIGMCLSNLYDASSVVQSTPPSVDAAEIVTSGEDVKDVSAKPATPRNNIFLNTPKIREPGYVGLPLPGVQVRLAEKIKGNHYKPVLECKGPTVSSPVIITYFEDMWNPKLMQTLLVPENADNVTKHETALAEEKSFPTGEILVKGDTVFKEYYKRSMETKLEFTSDGWFRTGDIALFDPKKQIFKILGRSSVDIIKTGAYKVSSLHIETLLLTHPEIEDVAVIALPDLTWGEKIAAILVLKEESKIVLSTLRDWAAMKMAHYCVPRVFRIVEEIPKNAMGKINKKELAKTLFADIESTNFKSNDS